MKPDQLEKLLENPPKSFDNSIFDRIHGSMIGMALGDALGAHVEFRPHEYLVEHPVTDLQGGGTWGLSKGQVRFDKLFKNLINVIFHLHTSSPMIRQWPSV